MEIIIHLNAKKISKDTSLALDEYIKRTSPFSKVTIKQYKKEIAPTLSKNSHVLLLIPGKRTISSEDFSSLINNICLSGYSCIEFVISNGLVCDDVIADNFSLSAFTMSNELTAVVLAEQIYRAYTISNNITYHK